MSDRLYLLERLRDALDQAGVRVGQQLSRDLHNEINDLSRRRDSVETRSLLLELVGIEDQILKGHFLNVHFRAFKLAHEAWQEHVRQNAVAGSRACNSPAGAVLDGEPYR